jgi:hypothetical protein
MSSSWANPKKMKPFYFEMAITTTLGKIMMDQATHSQKNQGRQHQEQN